MLKALSVSNDPGHLGDWPDNEYWHNRRVMVTGGNGFLGNPSTALRSTSVVHRQCVSWTAIGEGCLGSRIVR